MKRLEFGIESDGQPFLRVWHDDAAVRVGDTRASKYEFQSMNFFKLLPAEYVENLIGELWERPGKGAFIGCDKVD